MRKEFSRKIRAQIIARANGHCEHCHARLKPGEGDVDHILPCELGGLPTAANGRWICKPCHAEKTADDVRRIRKSDRQRDKASGAIAPKQMIQSPGFPKPAKAARPAKDDIPPLDYRKLFAPKETQA